MRRIFLALIASVLLVSGAVAATPADVTTPIKQFIDGFNTGDVKTAYAAYAPGTITIIDEFAPHRWVGPNAAHEWAADYDKHATATGVTDGLVKYDLPTRSVVDGDTAYVIIPALYTYKEHGQPMAEEGQMTFVLHAETAGWKIQGWTWTGVTPHAPK
jgi:ketosteroid isomerase-like protein